MAYAFNACFALADAPTVGYFRYRDVFQIVPPPPEAPLPPAAVGDYPFIIELSYQASPVGRKMPDGYMIEAGIVNVEIAQEMRKHVLLLLTAFTNFRMYIPSNHQGWFISLGVRGKEFSSKVPEWGQEVFFVSGYELSRTGFSEPSGPPANQSEPFVYFNAFGRSIGTTVGFPRILSELFDAAFAIEEDARRSLLASCSLLDQGIALWQHHPSLSFASCVSALETLIAYDHKNEPPDVCPTCTQKRFSVVKKFQQFFANYGSPTPEFKRYAQKVYRYRCNILHRGELFLGDVFLEKFGSLAGYDDRELHRNLIRTCRICIVNWVLAKHRAQPMSFPELKGSELKGSASQ